MVRAKHFLFFLFFLTFFSMLFGEEVSLLGLDFTEYPRVRALLTRKDGGVKEVYIDGVKSNIFSENLLKSKTRLVIGILIQEGIEADFLERALKEFSKDFLVPPVFTLWSYASSVDFITPPVELELATKSIPLLTHRAYNNESVRLTDAVCIVSSYLKYQEGIKILLVIGDGFDSGSSLNENYAVSLIHESGTIPFFIGNWESTQTPKKILHSTNYGLLFSGQKKDLCKATAEIFQLIRQSKIINFQGLGNFNENLIEFRYENDSPEIYDFFAPKMNVHWYLRKNPISDGQLELDFDLSGEENLRIGTRLRIELISSNGFRKSWSAKYREGSLPIQPRVLEKGVWLFVVTSPEFSELISGFVVFSKLPGPLVETRLPSLTNKTNITVSFIHKGGVPLRYVKVNGNTFRMTESDLTVPLTLRDGYNELVLEYIDYFGRIFGPITKSIFLDKLPPSLELSEIPKYTNKREIILNGYAQDNLQLLSIQIEDKQFKVEDDTQNFETKLKIAEGKNVFTIKVEDLAGNITTKTLEIFGDFSPPNILSLNYPHFTRESETILAVNAADDSGIHEITVDNQPFDPSTKFIPIKLPKNGENTVNISIIDLAGNITMKEITIVKDNEPPTISAPERFVFNDRTTKKIEFDVRDNFGVDSVTVDDKRIFKKEEHFFTEVPQLEPGARKFLFIKAIDLAGNMSQTFIEVAYDVEPPTISVNDGYFTTREIEIKDDFGLKKISYDGQITSLEGTTTKILIPFKEKRTMTITVEDTGGNVYSLEIKAYPWYLSPAFLIFIVAFIAFWIGIRFGAAYSNRKHKHHRVKLQ